MTYLPFKERTGGARAAYALRWALTPFRPRFSAGPEMLLPAAKEAFDASGRLVDSRAEATLVRAGGPGGRGVPDLL